MLCLCVATCIARNEELLSAVHRGDAAAVRGLLSRNSFDTNQMRFVDFWGVESTMLHEAADRGHAQVLQLLLTAWPEGAQARNSFGQVPLHSPGSVEVAQLLLEQWPDGLKVADSTGQLPLHRTASHDREFVQLELVRLLMQKWPDALQVVDQAGGTPLHRTCRHGNAEVAKVFVEQWPAGLNVTDRRGGLPLHWAAHSGSIELMQFLLERLPDALHVRTGRGETVLEIAAAREPLDYGDGALQLAMWIFNRSQPLPFKNSRFACTFLIQVACSNSFEVSQEWTDAARELKCHQANRLLKPALQLWLDVCDGSPSWKDSYQRPLVHNLYDFEAKDG